MQMSNSRRPLILCIDDDPAALALRCALLSAQGYEILTANNDEDPVKLFAANEVDLVISDHFLHGCTGAQVALAMKFQKPTVPIVLITSSSEKLEGAELVGLFSIKGSPISSFLSAIADLLSKDRALSVGV